MDALRGKVEDVFGPQNVREVDGTFLITRGDHTVCVTPTAARNHADVLEKIRDFPCAPGGAREWVRYGYVVIAERRGRGEAVAVERVSVQ